MLWKQNFQKYLINLAHQENKFYPVIFAKE